MRFSQLTEQDKKLISNYINDLADIEGANHKASLEEILRFWNMAKKNLYELLGRNLIISKKVQFTEPIAERKEKVYHMLQQKTARIFYDEMMNICRKGRFEPTSETDEIHRHAHYTLIRLFSEQGLATNSYPWDDKFPLPDGKVLSIPRGSKPIRAIGKIAAAYGIPGFEELRINHSQILNQKQLKGELCLSIHPLDYMTMSDNNSDWSSCMSWQEGGGYRRGTVEMMNSPWVIVAYLKSKEDMEVIGGMWNNKKWRTLIIATPDFISSIKGYPYQNDELTAAAISWIAELGRANLNWRIAEKIYTYQHNSYFITDAGNQLKFHMHTQGFMYNDFGSVDHQCAIDPDFAGICEFNYGDIVNCMDCGKVCNDSTLEEGSLVCDECSGFACYCACCDNGIYVNDNVFYIYDGEIALCENCYEEETSMDLLTKERVLSGELRSLTLSSSNKAGEWGTCCDQEIYILNDIDFYSQTTWNHYFKISEPRVVVHNYKDGIWHGNNWYVCVEDCTPEGLKLFGLNSQEDVDNYLNAE